MTQYQPQGFRLLSPAVKHLLIINVIFFGLFYLLQLRGINLYGLATKTFGMPFPQGSFITLNEIFGLWNIGTHGFRIWQPFTYMFMHGGWDHLFFNMFALWMFGNTMENYWGTRRFVFYYLVCGIGAGLINLLVPGWGTTVGASGAIYGLLLAFGMTFPNEYIYLYFLMPIKAKWFVIGYALIEVFEGFFSTGNVAHFAHLGGMLVGLILILWWRKHPFSRF